MGYPCFPTSAKRFPVSELLFTLFLPVKCPSHFCLSKCYPSFKCPSTWLSVSVLLYQHFLPIDLIQVHGFKYIYMLMIHKSISLALMSPLSSRFVYVTVYLISPLGCPTDISKLTWSN